MVSYHIINEFVKKFAGQLVRYAVDDIVHNHLTLIQADDWLDEFVLEGAAPMVQTVVRTRFNILLIVNYVLLYLKKGLHKSVSQHHFIGFFCLYLIL